MSGYSGFSGAALVTLPLYDNMIMMGASVGGNIGSATTQQNTLWIFPLSPSGVMPGQITASSVFIQLSLSGSTATLSAAHTSNFSIGVYTLNANQSQISLLSTATFQQSMAASTNNSTAWQGVRYIQFTQNNWQGSTQPVFSSGVQYFIALAASSAGSAAQTAGFMGIYVATTAALSGWVGQNVGAATSQGFYPFLGRYSATSGSFPAAINVSEINKQTASANFIPHIVLVGATNLSRF